MHYSYSSYSFVRRLQLLESSEMAPIRPVSTDCERIIEHLVSDEFRRVFEE